MIELNKNQKIIIGILLVIIFIVIGYYMFNIINNTEDEIYNLEEEKTLENNTEESKTQEIIVHVAGAVQNEGIQKLTENSRVADAIEAAGGLTIDANSNSINLAQKISDGQKIYIPYNSDNSEQKQEEIEQYTVEENSSLELININTASQTELEVLSGIGPSTASKIIDYRKENGNFKTIEDIKNVPGIGETKYDSIKNSITI